MSVLEMMESPEVSDWQGAAEGFEPYNLNRLIELSPEAMTLRKTLDLYHASQKKVRQVFGRRQTDNPVSDNRFSLQEFSQETQKYIHHIVAQKTAESHRQANFDALTHLPNRAYFHQRLHQAILEHENSSFALLFLDLDGFKAVNDRCSHQVGDELLKLVSARLQSAVRECDFISRLGGDEFCIIVPEDNLDNLKRICHRIIIEVSRVYWIEEKEIRISTSIGIALFPKDAQFANELIHLADQALYRSKQFGKKQACFYDSLIQVELTGSNSTESGLTLHDFEIQQRFWRDATQQSTLLQLETELKKLPDSDGLNALLDLKAVPNQVVMQWLWDTVDFYLDLLPAGDYEQVALQVTAKLMNLCGSLSSDQLPANLQHFMQAVEEEYRYKNFAVILTEKQWALLNDHGETFLHRLQQKHVRTYCQLQAPWAFDWSLIESFAIVGLVMDRQTQHAMQDKAEPIKTLFNQALVNFDLELWHLPPTQTLNQVD